MASVAAVVVVVVVVVIVIAVSIAIVVAAAVVVDSTNRHWCIATASTAAHFIGISIACLIDVDVDVASGNVVGNVGHWKASKLADNVRRVDR